MKLSRSIKYMPGAVAMLAALGATLPAALLAGEATVTLERVSGGLAEVSAAERSLTAPQRKMTQDLRAHLERLSATDSVGRAKDAVASFARKGQPRLEFSGAHGEFVKVYVWLKDFGEAQLAELTAAGAVVEEASKTRHLAAIRVPVEKLEAIAALDNVREVRRPSYATATSGSVQSQGDSAQGTAALRTIEGVNGAGVRVGVMSIGLFDSFAPQDANSDDRVLFGDLPLYSGAPPAPTSGFLGDVQIFPGDLNAHRISFGFGEQPPLVGDTPPFAEGAAILEVLYDVAPGAKFFYADGRNDLAFEAGRRFLLNRNVNIIVDNLVFYDTGRFDGTSTISRQTEAIASGREFFDGISNRPARSPIGYFVSAGAYTTPDQTTAGRFPFFLVDFFKAQPRENSPKVHNYAKGTLIDEVMRIDTDPASGRFEAILIWDDVWDDVNPRASKDLDLYVVDARSSSLDAPLASSAGLQNGQGLPIERLVFNGAGGGALPGLVIRKKDVRDNEPTLFTLLILEGRVLENNYLTHGIAVNNSDAPPPAISVGQISVFSDGVVLPKDIVPGLNPGPGLADRKTFLRWYEAQQVPGIVGYTDVYTLTTGGDDFTTAFSGPSAATAHLGGFAAMLRHRFPGVSVRDYHRLLSDTATTTANGTPKLANAILVGDPAMDELYERAPLFRRTEPVNVYLNLLSGVGVSAPAPMASVPVAGYESLGRWSQNVSQSIEPAVFDHTAQGLVLSAGGKQRAYGFWETPLVEFVDDEGNVFSELRADRLYEIVVRVGSDEADHTKVPDFRVRATSGTGEEAAMLVVSGLASDSQQAPTTIFGKTYRMYYRPSNEEVAKQGMRIAFELLKFDPNDNPKARLFLNSITVREITPEGTLAD